MTPLVRILSPVSSNISRTVASSSDSPGSIFPREHPSWDAVAASAYKDAQAAGDDRHSHRGPSEHGRRLCHIAHSPLEGLAARAGAGQPDYGRAGQVPR
jgi:hypothetical protein